MLDVAAAGVRSRAARSPSLSLASSRWLGSTPVRTSRSGRVTAVTWPAQRALGDELAGDRGPACRLAGPGRQPAPLTLIVVPDRRRLDSLTAGPGAGLGRGHRPARTRTILLRADEAGPARTLRHELAHLVLHEAGSVRVPLLVRRGVRRVAAGEWERLGGLELNLAVARGAVPHFRSSTGRSGDRRCGASAPTRWPSPR